MAKSNVRAEQILFIGNSFTSVNNLPAMVEAIATSKGRTASTKKVTKGGQGWTYHLSNPATDTALKSTAWNWVVLQDQSLNATHVASPGEFMKNGQAFYDRIAQEAPQAGILLYETWAYSAKHQDIAGTPKTPAKFSSPDQMYGEIHKSYAALQPALQAKDAKRRVLVAPVGAAFEKCVHDHPEINLYAPDFKHPSAQGTYLSALVMYATLFNDRPVGAADGKKIDPAAGKVLREIAAAVAQPSQAGTPAK